MAGRVQAIARREKPYGAMDLLTRAEVTIDRGVAGDFRGQQADRKVTVLALEDWAAACAALGQELPWTTRRANFLVEGIDLPQRVGARLMLGPVCLEVFEECDPCGRMEEAHAGLRAALQPDWRGGLACRVITGGEVEVGAAVTLVD